MNQPGSDVLRHVPNAISLVRLGMAPVLIWLTLNDASLFFFWGVVAAWLSDLLDGALARRFGWTSRLGASLDSVADVILILVTLYAIHHFHPPVFRDHGWVLAAVLAVWACVHASAALRYGRMASFHTRLARIGIVLYVVFVFWLFGRGFALWLYQLCGLVCFCAGLENLAMVWILREWRPDFQGGLLAALAVRRASD